MPADLNTLIPALAPSGRCLARLSSRSGMLTDLRRILDQGGAIHPEKIREFVVEGNLLARSSTSARTKLYKELKGRYLFDCSHPLFNAFIEEWNRAASDEEKNLLSFVMLALNDRTVHLISTDWFYPHLRKAESEARLADLETFLLAKGKSSNPEILEWTPATLRRVAQHYLASVRDCGMAVGTLRKYTHRPALYPAPVRLLLRALQITKVPLPEIVTHESFKIIGISPSEVADNLAELNRQDSIRFRQQADVIELSF